MAESATIPNIECADARNPTSIVAALDELLEPELFRDLGPNGLQVPGRRGGATVVTGVSAQRELIDARGRARTPLVLVHHGLFWGGDPHQITPVLAGA